MKNLFVLLFLIISLQTFAGKVIKNPEIEFSAPWMEIAEIELTKEATIVRGTLAPGCCIVNNSILMDRNSGKEYKFLRVEGVKAHEWASKETPCTIYFEPLASDVKEFHFIEVGNDPFGNFYGIKLQSKAKKSKAFNPESLNYDYYMAQPFTPDNSWHFSNEPYKDIITPGKAQMKIHLANLPKELSGKAPSLSIRLENHASRKENIVLANCGEDNCYTVDIDLYHPQYVYVKPFGNIFIAPDDTLEVFTTIESDPKTREPRYMTFRSKGESSLINTLLPKFVKKYGMKEIDYNAITGMIEKGKDAIQPVLERWANQVNEILANEEFRKALINSPLSTFGKDVVMMSALADKCIEVEDLTSRYAHSAKIQKQLDNGSWEVKDNPNYVPLDMKAIYGTMTKNKELIYNNPIAVCEIGQWVFVNRTLYGPLLRNLELVKDEKGNIIEQRRRDDFDMAGTFMNDLYLSQDANYDMEYSLKQIKLSPNREDEKWRLDFICENTSEALAGIHNAKVAQVLLSEYRNFVKATETGAADKGNGWTDEQNALWNKIVSPYKGNVLYIDFWGMGCGPCRAGMKSQKPTVDKMKDEAFKFIYVTTTDDKDRGEKWMEENSIKGEHIFVTPEEWKSLENMINFNAIPRGILVGKDGKLIENDFNVESYNTDQLKSFIERF